MALETLKGVKEIGGFKVVDRACDTRCTDKEGNFDWKEFDDLRKEYPIHITQEKNMISFRIQDGPIKEVGINGCQVDTLIAAARLILLGLDSKFPCTENQVAIGHFEAAIDALKRRKQDREKRNVEGTNNR